MGPLAPPQQTVPMWLQPTLQPKDAEGAKGGTAPGRCRDGSSTSRMRICGMSRSLVATLQTDGIQDDARLKMSTTMSVEDMDMSCRPAASVPE